ncbi:uncharacterized protein SPAPADRAFT_60332 [Spathaspora passalidarum NRRL Y-27907]|uniref:Ribosome maturation protein SDO1/SBDS N-terminal domain-containing protein n=1 Tax=Spathaspora passalidarum (strain NRRL Y-27907 / 11-Y1) TaxID=619300 RepID=G3AKW5_SPAPN|nr:uncharacterized protein SPAPADRAFT_60332 [Spathaspora passalidarum NRRL Y-27907]EGW33008.1 hypothetical protein SPAPADRAFT_60332 [Spathaspora passalidarum NRRL Y-27907]
MANPHKVLYKGQEVDFILFVDDIELLKKYRKGDTTIPLVDLVSVYKVFSNRNRGSGGIFDQASKGDLENEFGKTSVDDIIKKILIEGEDKKDVHLNPEYSSKNDSHGGRDSGN